jgi:eukaryotic-like serine/threonine-protein kinase
VWQWRRAEHKRVEAEVATVSALRSQARLGRWGGLAGQRFEGLAALKQAAALRPVPELRNEVIATLALPDLKVARGWEGYPEGSSALDWSADGKLYARSDQQGNLSVRTVDGDHLIGGLAGEGVPVRLLCLSSTGRYLASCAEGHGEQVLTVWDWRNKRSVLRLTNSLSERALAFSPDEAVLAVGDSRGSIQLFTLNSGGLLDIFQVGRAAFELQYSPEGTRLAISSQDSLNVLVLNTATGREVRRLAHPDTVRGLAWHPEGKLLAAACTNHQIYVWDVANAVPTILQGHWAAPDRLAFARRGLSLASWGYDRTLRLWEAGSGQSLVRLENVSCPVLKFRADDRLVGCAVADAQVQLLEVAWPDDCRPLPEMHPGPLATTSFCLSGDGRMLALATSDGVHLWDLSSRTELEPVRVGAVRSAAFLPHSGELVTLGFCGLHRFPAARERLRQDELLLLGPPRAFDCPPASGDMAVTPDGAEILVACRDRILLFDLTNDVNRSELATPGDLQSIAVSPDGKWIAAGNWARGEVLVWEAASRAAVTNLTVKGRAQIAFNPDSRWLATATEKECHLWKTGTWKAELDLVRGRTGLQPSPLAFSPAGGILAWASSEGGIDLIDMTNRAVLVTLDSPYRTTPVWMQFRPGGMKLVVASATAPIVVWDLLAVRSNLVTMGLDWSLPAWPAARPAVAGGKPARVCVDPGPMLDTQRNLESLRQLQAQLRSDPEDFQALKNRGNIYMHMRWFKEAVEDLDVALRGGTDAECLEDRAFSFLKLNRLQETLADSQRLLKLNPDHALARDRVCHIHLHGPLPLRNPEAARQLAQRVVLANPKDGKALFHLGVAEYRIGNYLQSLDYLSRAADCYRPRKAPSILLFQAMSYARLGQGEKAAETYEAGLAALEEAPKYVTDREYYNGFVAEAREVLRKQRLLGGGPGAGFISPGRM